MSSDAIGSICRAHLPPSLVSGIDALGGRVATSARGATVTFADGRDAVDLSSGGFGYSHPRVIEAVTEQVKRMPLSSRMFYSVPLAELLERIARMTPGDLSVSFFGNAGAEAMEGALKLVRGFHRKRTRVVAATNAHHGATTGALALCGIEALRRPVAPHRQPVDATWVPFGDADALERAVDERTAAVVLEPVQVAAGVVVPPAGYFRRVREHCTKTGALLIVDEVNTGFGLTGKKFGIDHDGVAPDIMVIAGVLGGGVLPIGAYVTTRAINDRVYDKRDPLLHANTTGGNPSACTAANTAIDVIVTEGLVARAADLGAALKQRLEELAQEHAGTVVSSASRGLLGSLQLRDAASAVALQRAAFERGVLLRLDGVAARRPSIGIRAPMMITSSELERGLAAMSAALGALARPVAEARTEAVG